MKLLWIYYIWNQWARLSFSTTQLNLTFCMRQRWTVSGMCLWICIPVRVSIKHWINVHDVLFTSLSVVKLILISWFIWEAQIKYKELWMSHRHKAMSPYSVCETVCFAGIINRLTCFTLQSCSALVLSGFSCQHSQEKKNKKITHL